MLPNSVLRAASLLLLPLSSSAQHVTVPSTCTSGYEAGTAVSLYTVPYTYSQVISIIGSYKNISWSGSPPDTVTLNGTDNTVGTARTYNIDGAHVIETLLQYSKPANGPYVEVHNTALFSVPALNVSIYIPFDGTVVTEVCGGRATAFNLTAHFCANNASLAAATLHTIHLTDEQTVGKFLGGANFTSCAALMPAMSNASATYSMSTPSSTVAPYVPGNAGAVSGVSGSFLGALAVVAGALML